MNKWQDLKIHPVLDPSVRYSDYCRLDLSTHNKELESIDISNSGALGQYVESVIKLNHAIFAIGGYLEQRNIYQRSPYFKSLEKSSEERNIHLGVDIWASAGTSVHAVMNGIIHSFANNTNYGDYGPTIILQHISNGEIIHSLYGHLSLDSIKHLQIGQKVQGGQQLARLGSSEVNGDYPPHLHFQFIRDLGDYKGDYPGVCSLNDKVSMSLNCPNLLEFLDIFP